MGDWSVFSSALACARLAMGDRAGAFDLLRRSAARLIENPRALNIQVTLATLLAEQGRSKEALATIEQVRALLTEPDNLGRPIPGALLQIDWIRACALHGLGRLEEANAVMFSVRSATQPEKPKKSLFMPVRRFDLLMRADSCAHDDKAMTENLSRKLNDPPLGSHAFVMVQPTYIEPAFDKATLDQARAQASTGPALRILPSRYRAALDHWSKR